MKAVTSKAMRAIDRSAVRDYGMRSIQLMENAGRGVATVVRAELLSMAPHSPRVVVVAGKGNNGGDGFVVARHLHNSGVNVSVLALAGLKEIKGDAGVNARTWWEMGGELLYLRSGRDLKKHAVALKHSSVIVDGMLGTGLTSPVRGLYARTIEFINTLEKKVVAIDVPSGIDATTGAMLGVSIRADVTATMACPKTGFFLHPGRAMAGRVEVVDIGLPHELVEDAGIRWNVITGDDLRSFLKGRAPDSHKGVCGHLLVLAGSPGHTGAAYMAAMGAMRTGAGLATIGLPASLEPVMEAKTTEVMTFGLPETADKTLGAVSFEKISMLLEGKSALVIGPGLGCSREVFRLLEKVIRVARAPMVIDADGLNALDGRLQVLKDASEKDGTNMVLTPHPGEAARLLKIKTREVQADRLGAAEAIAERTNCIVVLKGACTIIAVPGDKGHGGGGHSVPGGAGEVYFNTTGNAGLASAGTGDVLSGMIGGLLAQGYRPLDAALGAVYAHGLAADQLAEESGEAGLVATDLLPIIPGVLNSFTCARKARVRK